MLAASLRPPRRAQLKVARLYLLIGGLGVATVGGIVVGNGSPVVALAPILAATVLWLMVTLPLRVTTLAFLQLALIGDYIAESFNGDLWQSPLRFVGLLFYQNFNHLTGIGALRFQGSDAVIALLCGVAIYRRATGKMKDHPSHLAAALPPFVLLSLGGILYLEARGALAGGNMRESLWQIHQLAFVPLLFFLFASCFRGSKDLRALGTVVVVAACVKAGLCAYFIYGIVRPRGLEVEYATTHSDTLTFVAALALLSISCLERPGLRRFIQLLPIMLWIFWGVVLNDRRIAYVTMAGCFLTVMAMAPWGWFKRWVVRLMILSLPLMPVYIGVGWNKMGFPFGPVQQLKGLMFGERDDTPDYRDLENFNIIMTWMNNPVLGSGAGHEFDMVMQLPDISKALPTWRYHPHNQVLWLWSNGGLLGFSMVWLYLLVAVFLGARTYHATADPRLRIGALTCICIVIAYINQFFGDMGALTWIGSYYVAAAVTIIGQLAVEAGAWPSRGRPATATAAVEVEPVPEPSPQ